MNDFIGNCTACDAPLYGSRPGGESGVCGSCRDAEKLAEARDEVKRLKDLLAFERGRITAMQNAIGAAMNKNDKDKRGYDRGFIHGMSECAIRISIADQEYREKEEEKKA